MRLPAAALAAGLVLALSPVGALPASATTAPPSDAATGLDVSRWQHQAPLDWNQVAASGVAFAIVKATEGNGYTSSWFDDDSGAAAAAGLVRGSYHYARPALPISTAVDQARRYAAVLGDVRQAGVLPPVLDLEEDGGLAPHDLVTWAQAFLDELRARTGRTPMVYTYPWFWRSAMADSAAFHRFPLWIAGYGTATAPSVGSWPSWTLWQYTASATVAGVAGPVDSSTVNPAGPGLAALADGTVATAWPVQRPSAPVHLTATADGTTATVSWVPGDDGGTPTTGYRVQASTGQSASVSGRTTAATLSGLPAGRSVTFTVVPANAAGVGTTSARSAAVTTTLPTTTSLSAAGPVGLGGPAGLSGRLTRRGVGLAGRRVEVLVQAGGATGWVHDRWLTTGPDGSVRWSAPLSVTTSVLLRYAGTALERPSSARTTVQVVPALVARLSAATVRLGGSVTLSGTAPAALAGQSLLRQGLVGGVWRTWDTTTVRADGTYGFLVTPTVRASNTYRVVLPATPQHAAATTGLLQLTVS